MKANMRFYLVGCLIAIVAGWSTYSLVLAQPPQTIVDQLRVAEDAKREAEEQFTEQREAFEAHLSELAAIDVARPKSTRAEVVIERTIRTELKKLQGDVTADVKQSVQKALVKNVGLLFDARQKQRVAELDNMEKELKRLRAMHERREAEKERIVNDRVQQLVREKEGLGWGDDSRRLQGVDWALVNIPEDSEAPADLIEPVAPVEVPVPAAPARPPRR